MKFKQIDENLTTYITHIRNEIENIELNEICEFKIKDAVNVPFKELKYKGIYLFEIKNNFKFETFEEWVREFQKRWEIKYSFTPNIVKKRIAKHNVLKEWIPLYIGKSKNVGSRINEHIFKEMKKPTFALKLDSRKNMRDETFKIKTIKLDVVNYDTILPIVESGLREIIHPIVGRQ